MLTRLSAFFFRQAKGKWILLLAAALPAFVLVLFPRFSIYEADQDRPAALDLALYYTPAEAFARLDALGELGRRAYIQSAFTVDLAWPIVYTLFLVFSLSWLLARTRARTTALSRLNLLPLLPFLFDLGENVSLATLAALYPTQPWGLAVLAGLFTLLKWLTVGLTLLVLGFVILARALRQL